MKNYRKGQFITIVVLLIVIITLGVGFSAFSTMLNISSSASVTPNSGEFMLGFYDNVGSSTGSMANIYPNVEFGGATGSAITLINGDTSISGLNVYFTNPGQTISYLFTVKNMGKYDAYLNKIAAYNVSGEDAFKVCIPGDGTTASLVESSCDGINIEVVIDGMFFPVNGTINYSLDKGSAQTILINISYDDGFDIADGPFSVNFGNLELIYSSAEVVVPDKITFTIEGISYQAEKGMTWNEWVNSSYNIDGYYCSNNYVYTSNDLFVANVGTIEKVFVDDIIENGNYFGI